MKYLKYIIAFFIIKKLILISLIDKHKEIVVSTLAMQLLFFILIVFLFFVLKRAYKKRSF